MDTFEICLRYIWREPAGPYGSHMLGLVQGGGEGTNQQLVLEFWLKHQIDDDAVY